MSQQQLLAQVTRVLEAAGIPYMLTGSFVSSSYGQARATHDIDLIVNIREEQVSAISRAFPKEEYAFDEIAAKHAIAIQQMFQLWQHSTGDQIDFWLLKNEPFAQTSFGRRRRETIIGVDTYLPTPEDIILQKLSWAQEYESEKQYRDALGVFELQFAKLDMSYLRDWVLRLKISEIWDQMLSEANPLT